MVAMEQKPSHGSRHRAIQISFICKNPWVVRLATYLKRQTCAKERGYLANGTERAFLDGEYVKETYRIISYASD